MKHLLTPRLALALALSSAVIPFAIAGCGGGNGSGNGSPTPTPTATPKATATPTPMNTAYTVTGNLSFSNVLPNTSITTTPITTFDTNNATSSSFGSRGIFDRTSSGTSDVVTFSANQDIPNTASEKRAFDIILVSDGATVPNAQFIAGQKFNIGDDASASLGTAKSSATANDGSFFTAKSGQIEILSVGTTSIAVRLTNARFTPFFSGSANGGFDLSGTLNAINISAGVIESKTAR